MQPDRFRRIRNLFEIALDHDPAFRDTYLQGACQGDPDLYADVSRLLAAHDEGRSWVDGEREATVHPEVGSTLGAYEIVGLLGVGGMGEVYRARDAVLNREVAIKVLPRRVSRNPERNRRFRQEAQTLAALNHPHIAQVYDLEEFEGALCLVLELVPGETLAERLERGPLSVGDALTLAGDVAKALEDTHERDILHRDLKPANIKITPDGVVKVLDFGLATPADASSKATERETPVAPSTGGSARAAIVGTAAYMSPEQASGLAVDARSDVWGFGCVLYEMLTGRRAFDRGAAAETLAAVLDAEPDWSRLPVDTPSSIRTLLKRCLEKDPRRRLRNIGDAWLEIDAVLAGPNERIAGRDARRLSWRTPAAFGLALVVVAGWVLLERRVPVAGELRLQMDALPGASLFSHAISPDGTQVVFQATVDGTSQLFLRPLDADEARPIPGTEASGSEEELPCWRPDSRALAFFAGGQLKRVDLDDGLVRTVAAATDGGCAWNATGTILFATSLTSPIYRIDQDGGERQAVTSLAAHENGGHAFPQFLPDGRRFLFFGYGTLSDQGVYQGSLDSADSALLFASGSAAVVASADHVLFADEGALVAQRLDRRTLERRGQPARVAPRVVVDPVSLRGAYSASATGRLVYRAEGGTRQLVWVDRRGTEVQKVGSPDQARPTDVRLSSDGAALALVRTVGANPSVWRMDVERGLPTPVTPGLVGEFTPLWSCGRSDRIFLGMAPLGVRDLYEADAGGAESPSLVLQTGEDKGVLDCSRDGAFLLYWSVNEVTGRDLWALPLDAPGEALPLARAAGDESEGRFSPDGRFILFQSNKAGGRAEVYYQRFPGEGGEVRVSPDGGAMPQWRADGAEIFYLAPGNRLMAAPVARRGDDLDIGTPELLFTLPPQSTYVAGPDGRRFLLNTVAEAASPLAVIVNWQAP